MLKLVFVLLFSCIYQFTHAQIGYKIDVNIKKFANEYVYLGYYFGPKNLPIKDSIKLDKLGKGSFKGKEKLIGGVYLLGFPGRNKFAEFIINKSQHFSITFNPDDVVNTLSFTNNLDGTEFQNYQKFINLKGKRIEELGKQTQTELIKTERQKLANEVEVYRNNIIKKNPKGMLTTIFNLMQRPTIPEGNKHPGGKYDSNYAWYYYKTNFWNNIDFNDQRILRTPVFESKFEEYFENIVFPSPDSIKRDVDKILTASYNSKDVFKYTSSKLTERYVNPKIMGLDAVFVHIYEKYIATNKMDWFDDKQKKFLNDRYYFLVGNLIGEPAAQLILQDTVGKPVNLYEIQAPYTIVVFWDATCGHCQEVVPKLDSIYVNKWKAKGIKLLGVMTDGGIDAYKKYIVKHNFSSWMHAYQTEEQRKADGDANRPNFRQLYDIQSSPKIFLLDDLKRIKAKQITWDQLDNILDQAYKK
jgi:hypothetical protein